MKVTSLVALCMTGGTAAAEVVYVDEPDPMMYPYRDGRLMSGIGIGVSLGAGVAGFTDDDTRDAMDEDIAGLWTARLSIGTHIPLGLEISYVGTSVDLDQFRDAETPSLLGTGIEGAVRYNMLPQLTVNPYIFGGIGWQRYDIVDGDLSQAATGIRDEDDLMIFPVGAGLSIRSYEGIMFDIRGTIRIAEDSGLIRDATGDNGHLHTWEASGNLGYEF